MLKQQGNTGLVVCLTTYLSYPPPAVASVLRTSCRPGGASAKVKVVRYGGLPAGLGCPPPAGQLNSTPPPSGSLINSI